MADEAGLKASPDPPPAVPRARRGRVRRAGRGCLFTVAVLLALFLAVMASPSNLSPRVAAESRGPAVAGLPWLSVKSGRIVDDGGRTVLLRGYNTEALLDYPDRPAAPLDDQDATMMAQSGVDVVRLPLSWSQIEPTRGQVNEAYLNRVVAAVEMLNRHGIYVVPDMHFYPNWGPAYGGAGAPAWAGFSGVPDIPHESVDIIRKNFSPAANVATTYFWASTDWQDDFLTSWKAVASRLKGVSGVAGYDIYNEPRPGPMPPLLFEKLWMWPLMSRAIEAIGGADPNHLFIVESTLFVDLPTWTVPIHAANVVYSPHIYTGTLVPPAFDGNRDRLTAEWQQRQREADQMSAPMWVGEFGTSHAADHATAWADAMLDAADDFDAGWAWWQWRQDDNNWAIRSFDGQRYDRRYLVHLARPYLAAAPGGIRGGHGDGLTGRISIHVAPGHDGGAAELAWSTLTTAGPQASGPCLLSSSWQPERNRLVLTFKAGEGCTVEVSS